MPFEADDGSRPKVAVVVSLLDREDGTSRIIIDDVRNDRSQRETSWQFDCFYTHKRVDSGDLDHMRLSDAEFKGLGEAVLARLLALNGRAK